jgi:hypothetical protein
MCANIIGNDKVDLHNDSSIAHAGELIYDQVMPLCESISVQITNNFVMLRGYDWSGHLADETSKMVGAQPYPIYFIKVTFLCVPLRKVRTGTTLARSTKRASY